MKTERKGCAITFLKAAVACYARLGITVERVMTDNGSCYKAFAFRGACKRLGLRHIRPDPAPLKQTVRPNASSRPLCANGPMQRPTILLVSAPPSCLTECINTTGIDLMAVSDPCHPSANSALPGITCCSTSRALEPHIPNQRARRLEPKFSFSARMATEGS